MGKESKLNKLKKENSMSDVNYGTPLNGLILIRKTGDVAAKIGGIHIPESTRQKPSEGIVLAVGEERITEFGFKMPNRCQVGDRVLFGKYSGTEITIDGNTFLIMKTEDIVMILPPKTEEQITKELADAADERFKDSGLIIN